MGFLFQVKAISIIRDFTLVFNKTVLIQDKTHLSYLNSVSPHRALEIYSMLTEIILGYIHGLETLCISTPPPVYQIWGFVAVC